MVELLKKRLTHSFIMIPIFSGLLAWMVYSGWFGLVSAKILVTIPSFLANYFFLKWLVTPYSTGKTEYV